MIKKLSASVREYKKDSIMAAVYVFLEVVMDVAIPLMMAYLIDEGIEAGQMSKIIKAGLILVVMVIASLILGILSGNKAAHGSAGFAKNLRSDVFDQVQEFSFENIDKFSSSSLITRLTTDITNIQNAYQMIIRTAVRAPIMMLFATIAAFTIRPNLAVVYIIVVPIAAIGLYLIITKAHPLFERVFRTYDKLNKVVQENVHGIRVVKSYVQEDSETEKFEDISGSIYKDFSKAEKILAFNGPVMQFGIYACMIFIAWFGATAIINGSGMTTGNLMSMILYTMQILMNLMMLSMVFVIIVIARSSAERVTEILDEKSSISNADSPVYEMNDSTIKFDNVSFSYSGKADKLALYDVNLTIKPGETVGIIGGTGSSKTTLVQLIPRLYDVTKGELMVGGVDVRNYDLDTLRNEVAMVLQKNVLFSGSIKDNLRWGNEHATLEQMKRACKQAQAADFIEALPDKYDSHVEQGGANFSGGQKQRLCIARALLKNPKILILDDSTSAVDTKTDALIRAAFKEDIPETTKIIIAQRISSVQEADKIIVMEDGYIDGIGTHDELIESNKIYQEVYYSQNQNSGPNPLNGVIG